MRITHIYRTGLLSLIATFLLAASCEREPEVELPEEILILNNWIWTGMNDAYLWEQYIPYVNPDQQPDPEAYFYKLLFEDDRDSWIVQDYEALAAMFDGVQLTTGISASPGLIGDSEVITIVEYVTPNSPAADSGIARGDIIYAVDGQRLDTANYHSLYYQTSATLEFADWDGQQVVPNGRKITLTAVELNQNPVIHSEVIDYEGFKIGYFVYTQFTTGENDEWLQELNDVFEDFIAAGISEVVVDLRYNGGGSLDLSAYLASSLGSSTAMQNNDVFVNLVWNEGYNEFWKEYDLDKDGEPDGEDSEQLVIKLPESQLNMNLPRVYFLTTRHTASASESLIVGLYPYAEVMQIGTTTYGKCYGSVTIRDWEDPKRHSWAMQPIVLKYSNAEGFTDFVHGIMPDFDINDNLLYAEPFGSLQDPLLGKALEDITGVAPARKKSTGPVVEYRALPVPRKPIPERMIDWPRRPERSRF